MAVNYQHKIKMQNTL